MGAESGTEADGARGVPTTRPRPFVFVLMPFDPAFDDLYTFGIKGAAEEAGAYAERVDEQVFAEGMLERIFNQISKADVIVADMTGRNANVFYEVGYAHALGKIVLLLTQRADDIPFDLKHRAHVVYGGSIETLKKELTPRIRWGVEEAAKGRAAPEERFLVSIGGVEVRARSVGFPPEVVFTPVSDVPAYFDLSIDIVNASGVGSHAVPYVYLFLTEETRLRVLPENQRSVASALPLVTLPITRVASGDPFRTAVALPGPVPPLPPGALHSLRFGLYRDDHREPFKAGHHRPCRLRLHTDSGPIDYDFLLECKWQEAKATHGRFSV